LVARKGGGNRLQQASKVTQQQGNAATLTWAGQHSAESIAQH